VTEDFSHIYTIPIKKGYHELVDELAKYLSDMLGYKRISFTTMGQKVKMINTGEFVVDLNISLAQ